MTVKVIWPDGHYDAARTWAELERQVRSEAGAHYSALGYRREMRRRAWVWSKTRIRVLCTAREFFAGLERSGMLRIA